MHLPLGLLSQLSSLFLTISNYTTRAKREKSRCSSAAKATKVHVYAQSYSLSFQA